MKKLLLLALCVAGAVSAYGQGSILFANASATFQSPVFDVDGTTRLAGPQYMAALVINGTEVATAPFRTGAGAGFFNGGEVTVAGVAFNAAATAVVRAWDTNTGATYDAASLKGESASWQLTLTGNPAGQPPVTPGALVGMPSFNLVPEPSTIALAVLGGVALLFRRRK